MKRITILFLMASAFISSSPITPYVIYDSQKSKAVSFEKMMKGLKNADVVFFGELHNNSICHWLQLQVLKELGASTGKSVVAGAEMFEADVQVVVNEYLQGIIREDHLINESKAWKNYKTDYAPMVNFAKKHQIPFIATNIPRRYANLVSREGLDALEKLDETARQWVAPLPITVDFELSTYKEMSEMMGGHGGTNMVAAQAVKDATMAFFISENLSEGSVFYHINGSFHSKRKEGIIHYLLKLRPGLNIVTISVVESDKSDKPEAELLAEADYMIIVPADMTKTY